MKVKEITLQGDSGYTCTISISASPENKLDNELFIKCEMYDEEGEMANIHYVSRDDKDDQHSMAQCIQHILDGCRGTNSMVHDYLRYIQLFCD